MFMFILMNYYTISLSTNSCYETLNAYPLTLADIVVVVTYPLTSRCCCCYYYKCLHVDFNQTW